MATPGDDPDYQELLCKLSHGMEECEKDPKIKAKIKEYADELWKKRVSHNHVVKLMQCFLITLVVAYLFITFFGDKSGSRGQTWAIIVLAVGAFLLFWGTRK